MFGVSAVDERPVDEQFWVVERELVDAVGFVGGEPEDVDVVGVLERESGDFFHGDCAGRSGDTCHVAAVGEHLVDGFVFVGADDGDWPFDPRFDVVQETPVVGVFVAEQVAVDDFGVGVFVDGEFRRDC